MLQEEVKISNSLQHEGKIHEPPSTLDVRVTKLKDALKETAKRYQDTSNSIKEKTRQVKEHQKAILQGTKALADTLKDLQD